MGVARCEKCGVTLSAAVEAGFCPDCTEEEPTAGPTPTVTIEWKDDPVSPWRLTKGSDRDGRPMVETRIGPYELHEEIGRGGMGVVYRAVHSDLGRQVAIKMIHANAAADEQQRAMLLAEARTAAQVRHPNVVGVYGIGEIHGWQYMAMELVEGTSLAGLMRKGSVDPRRAVRLVRQVALAMQHLHDQGIIHRDIKPSNILVDARDVPYITDFGLAKVREMASALSQAGLVAGTPSYMSPEQALGHAVPETPLADVYSLGAVLYSLLTGKPPFEGKTVPETLLMVTRREPIPPRRIRRDVPAALEQICLKCLEKDPTRRYGSMGELATDLAHFLDGEPVDAEQIPMPRRVKRWWRRSPPLAARYTCLWTFFLIEQAWFHGLQVTSSSFYWTTTILTPCWAATTAVLAWLVRKTSHGEAAQALWLCFDASFLTAVLLSSEGMQHSPLVSLYAVLVVASGLWYRLRIVWLAVVLCILSNLVLWLAAPVIRPEWQEPLHVHLVFCASLPLIGLLVAHQVRQIRAMRGYLPKQRPVM